MDMFMIKLDPTGALWSSPETRYGVAYEALAHAVRLVRTGEMDECVLYRHLDFLERSLQAAKDGDQ